MNNSLISLPGKCLGLGLALTLLTGASGNRPDAAEDLITAFSQSCESSGEWTEASINHSFKMIRLLESIKQRDPCKDQVETLSTVQSLMGQTSDLLADTTFADFRNAEELVQELTLSLNNSSDPDIQSALADALVTAQVDLTQARAANNAFDEHGGRDRFAQGTAHLGATAQALMASTEGLNACLRAHPEVAVQLATNLIATGGSFISPVHGAAAATIAQLINLAIEIARSAAFTSAIWSVHENLLPTAFTCALESNTDFYCQANDAFDLIELQRSGYQEHGELPHSIWKGPDIISRRLPILINWLARVKNGGPPGDGTEAERRNNVWKKVQQIANTERSVTGGLNETRRLYSSTTDPAVKESLVLSALRGYSFFLSGQDDNKKRTPFTDLTRDMILYACWFSLGINSICPDHSAETPFDIFAQRYLLAGLTPDSMIRNWSQIVERVKAKVDVEFAQTITIDPSMLVTEANEAEEVTNLTPREVLSLIQEYLEEMLARDPGRNPHRKTTLQETIDLIYNATVIIDEPLTSTEDALERIKDIFDVFQLYKEVQYFNGRIRDFVRWDLQDHLVAGKFPESIEEIIRAAGGDIYNRLTAAGVKNKDLDRVTTDLNTSRFMTQGNIGVLYYRGFKKLMNRSLKKLAAEAKKEPRSGHPSNRPHAQTLGRFCTLILSSTEEWPRGIQWKYCKGAELYSIYHTQKNPLHIELDQLKRELTGKTFGERACTYYQFKRQGKLADRLNRSRLEHDDAPGRLSLWDLHRRAWIN